MPTGKKDLEILLVSVLGLFYEVLLIRWVGTEVRIFAYLQNTVLVVCFLGLGAGAFWHRRPVSRLWMVAPALAFGLLLAVPWTHQFLSEVPNLLSPLASEIAWVGQGVQTLPTILAGLAGGVLAVLALMMVVAIGFVPIGQILGRAVRRASAARSERTRGTCSGASSASGASRSRVWLGLGPTMWLAITGALMVPFLAPRVPGIALVALSVVLVFVGGSRRPRDLVAVPEARGPTGRARGRPGSAPVHPRQQRRLPGDVRPAAGGRRAGRRSARTIDTD